MSTMSYFIILLLVLCRHLFVSCRSVQTEFEIDFQPVEKKLTVMVMSNSQCSSNCSDEGASECKCLWKPQKCKEDKNYNCTDDKCIEEGLKELNFVCDENNKNTHNICRVLDILQEIGSDETTLCEQPLAQRPFLEHIKSLYQKSNS